jgi:hypothetical protein
MGVGHAPALVAAEDGAVLLAPGEVKVIVVVSIFPAESVTVSVKVPRPDAVTFTFADVAPETIWTPPVGWVHAYEAIVAPQAAALPLASNVAGPVV